MLWREPISEAGNSDGGKRLGEPHREQRALPRTPEVSEGAKCSSENS